MDEIDRPVVIHQDTLPTAERRDTYPSPPASQADSGKDEASIAAADAKRKRRRTTAEQLDVLEQEFRVSEKPNGAQRDQISLRLQRTMSSREIQVWFQNRRQAARRQAQQTRRSESDSELSVLSTKRVARDEGWQPSTKSMAALENKGGHFPALKLSTTNGGKAEVMFDTRLASSRLPLAPFNGDNVMQASAEDPMTKIKPVWLSSSKRPPHWMRQRGGKENVPPSVGSKTRSNTLNTLSRSRSLGDGAQPNVPSPLSVTSPSKGDVEKECALSLMGLSRSSSFA